MIFIENHKIASLTLKMKTFAIVYIKSKCCYRSKATPETAFVRPWYAKSRHFDQNPHFTFSKLFNEYV